MDWLDATTAALAIIAVPLALRFPLRTKEDPSSCDCTTRDIKDVASAMDQYRTIPQEEEPSQERQPERRPPSHLGSR